MNTWNQGTEALREVPAEHKELTPAPATPSNSPEQVEIDLLELAFLLLDRLHFILLFFLTGALILNAYSYFFIHPSYQSTASIYIVSASGGSVVDLTDLNIGSNLKNDYKELIMSYPVLDRVSEQLELGLSTRAMQNMITITNPTDTRILKLTATAQSPELARDIANTLAEVAVEFLPETMSTDAPNIAQRARLEKRKTAPSYSKFTLMGGMIGAMAYCAWVVVQHLMDDTIHGESDAQDFFGSPPLATIPYALAMDTEKRTESAEPKQQESVAGVIHVNIPTLPYSAEEALNRLRVNVKFSGKNTRRILVTSSVPNEGKSHIAIHLWKMLADAGHRTLLLDADLRKSVMKKTLQFASQEEYHSLAYYLSGLSEYQDVIYKTNIENADIIPCVNLLQNPSSLLEDPRLKELLNHLAEDYDYVIIDTPPLVSVSDGALIAALCDGAIVVVRSGETPRALIRQSLTQLERAHCRVLGTVLNGVSAGIRGYGYGRYYYGGYYYGRYYSKYYGNYYANYYGGTENEGEAQKKHKKHKWFGKKKS